MGEHYRIERWLTGTKGFSLLQKSRLDIEKKATSHYYVSAHYEQNTFSHKSATGRTIIAALSLFQRERWRQNLKLTLLTCTHTFIYLYITITVTAAWQIHHHSSPTIRLDLQSTQPDE